MTIEERLERLEGQNTILKACLVALAGVSLACIFLGLFGVFGGSAAPDQEPVPDIMRAKAFHVVGDDGRVLIKLEDTSGLGASLAGTITTLNGNGQELVRLTATTTGEGVVTTTNGEGQELVKLTATTDGKGVVTTTNGKGQELIRLGATKGGRGSVTTMNSEGQELVGLSATEDGRGAVTTRNGKGQELVRLTATDDGRGAVLALDPSSVQAAGILTSR